MSMSDRLAEIRASIDAIEDELRAQLVDGCLFHINRAVEARAERDAALAREAVLREAFGDAAYQWDNGYQTVCGNCGEAITNPHDRDCSWGHILATSSPAADELLRKAKLWDDEQAKLASVRSGNYDDGSEYH